MQRFRFRIFLVCFLAAVPVIGFGLAGADSHGDMPPADAEALWTYITTTNPYSGWNFVPGHEGMHPGQSPHGAFLKVYVNQAGYDAIQAGDRTLPPGSIVVKENYAKDRKTLMALTPMYKVEGFAPDNGNWFWGKYGPKGEVMAAGKLQGCIDCHRTVSANDWLFTLKEH